MHKIGNKAPSYIGNVVSQFYNEETEMNYVVYRDDSDYGWVLAAEHDAVGQVTYYDVTEAEVNQLWDEAEKAWQ